MRHDAWTTFIVNGCDFFVHFSFDVGYSKFDDYGNESDYCIEYPVLHEVYLVRNFLTEQEVKCSNVFFQTQKGNEFNGFHYKKIEVSEELEKLLKKEIKEIDIHNTDAFECLITEKEIEEMYG